MMTGIYAQSAEKLKWYTFAEAQQLNKKNPKKFLIDVYTDWCGWCKVMDQNTFNNATIAAIIDKYFYPVKFNAEKDADVDYKGKTYKLVVDPNTKKGYHELTQVLFNGQSSGYPTICYMDQETNIIQAISGYQTPQQIEPILQFFGSDSYKSISWESFTTSFKSELK
jgi:thioredoxin-related protein